MPSTKKRRRAKRHAERLAEEAIEAAGLGQHHLAEKLIQRALSAGPANARFWVEQARIALLRGTTGRAERAVRRALELSPGYAEAQVLLDELAPAAAPAEPEPAETPAVAEEIVFTARTERFDWARSRKNWPRVASPASPRSSRLTSASRSATSTPTTSGSSTTSGSTTTAAASSTGSSRGHFRRWWSSSGAESMPGSRRS